MPGNQKARARRGNEIYGHVTQQTESNLEVVSPQRLQKGQRIFVGVSAGNLSINDSLRPPTPACCVILPVADERAERRHRIPRPPLLATEAPSEWCEVTCGVSRCVARGADICMCTSRTESIAPPVGQLPSYVTLVTRCPPDIAPSKSDGVGSGFPVGERRKNAKEL